MLHTPNVGDELSSDTELSERRHYRPLISGSAMRALMGLLIAAFLLVPFIHIHEVRVIGIQG